MYIKCKNCQSTFLIDRKIIGPKGKKVKCSKCQHIWLEEYRSIYQEVEAMPKAEHKPLGANFLPVIVNNANIDIFKKLYLVLVCIITVVGFVSHTNDLIKQNEYINHNLKISLINCNQQNQQLTLHYKILNYSNDKIDTPEITIKLLDKNNKVLYTQQAKLNIALEANNYIYVSSMFENIPDKTQYYSVTMSKNTVFF